MVTFEIPVDFETPHGPLEGVPAVFDLELEEFPAEDFAPAEISVSAKIDNIHLAGTTLRGNELEAWIGRDEIARLETFIEDTYECS